MERKSQKIRPKPVTTPEAPQGTRPPRNSTTAFRLLSHIRSVLITLAMGILAGPALAGDLTGRWQFVAETPEGRLSAQIDFIQAEGKTQARMSIDGHILEGDVHGSPSGFTLELHDREAPGGPAHDHHLSLKGKLTGEELAGTWDDGRSQGTWTGRRE
jgi:hypothetical protein